MKYKFATTFVLGLTLGGLVAFFGQPLLTAEKSNSELIAEYYRIENATHVSPHGLRGKMDKGDKSFILVDVRSQEEYEKEHVIGAINVPAYKDKYTAAYGDVERIVNSFKEIVKDYPDRDIIVYCYSTPCMTGRKVGGMLAENGIYVKQLNIGWYDWRHDWNSWNHEHEWDTTKVEDYIWSGDEPGEQKPSSEFNPCTEGEFGC